MRRESLRSVVLCCIYQIEHAQTVRCHHDGGLDLAIVIATVLKSELSVVVVTTGQDRTGCVS